VRVPSPPIETSPVVRATPIGLPGTRVEGSLGVDPAEPDTGIKERSNAESPFGSGTIPVSMKSPISPFGLVASPFISVWRARPDRPAVMIGVETG